MHQDYTIAPAADHDIPVLAEISYDSFLGDAQTEMKSYGPAPFNMREYMLQSLPETIRNPKTRVIKAFQHETGALMGFCIWGFRGIDPPVFPDMLLPQESQSTGNAKRSQETCSDERAVADVLDDPIQRLDDLTSKDFRGWRDSIMADNTRCMYVVGLYVSPTFQRRGIGSALLRWGTELADSHGIFAWVHSSHDAWRVYDRAGFKTSRILEVDLDKYAPVPAPVGRYEDGKWGKYIFRYMIYGSSPNANMP